MRRARRSFWMLFAVAVLAAGGLSWSLGAEPGPLAGVAFGASALLLVATIPLAVRILLAVEGRRVH